MENVAGAKIFLKNWYQIDIKNILYSITTN